MAMVVIVGDDSLLKNITDTVRVLREYGHFSLERADDVINLLLKNGEANIEIDDLDRATQLAAELDKVIGIRASIKSEHT